MEQLSLLTREIKDDVKRCQRASERTNGLKLSRTRVSAFHSSPEYTARCANNQLPHDLNHMF
jgi:hypothetical protein